RDPVTGVVERRTGPLQCCHDTRLQARASRPVELHAVDRHIDGPAYANIVERRLRTVQIQGLPPAKRRRPGIDDLVATVRAELTLDPRVNSPQNLSASRLQGVVSDGRVRNYFDDK